MPHYIYVSWIGFTQHVFNVLHRVRSSLMYLISYFECCRMCTVIAWKCLRCSCAMFLYTDNCLLLWRSTWCLCICVERIFNLIFSSLLLFFTFCFWFSFVSFCLLFTQIVEPFRYFVFFSFFYFSVRYSRAAQPIWIVHCVYVIDVDAEW